MCGWSHGRRVYAAESTVGSLRRATICAYQKRYREPRAGYALPRIGLIFDHDGPALLDVVTDPNALELSPHITAQEVNGFLLSTSRTVLDGDAGGIVDLARSNLRNVPRP